jgi:hypothetical protein
MTRVRSLARALTAIEIWPLAALHIASGFEERLFPVMLAVAALFRRLRLAAAPRSRAGPSSAG